MARPPPARDADPDLIEFGIPVLDDRLQEADLSFPATRDELEASLGSVEVPHDPHGHAVTLAEALDGLDQRAFVSRHDLLDALHPVFEARRRRAATGLVGRLRSMLPR